ncbi:MAG: hypothetical protein FWD29_06200 [Micrococcales bacterium]|nr:hypothetical protein [Micrococcales bacterium]
MNSPLPGGDSSSPGHAATKPRPGTVWVEFQGQRLSLEGRDAFGVGREGDLAIDGNPFLHRQLLSLEKTSGLWWIINVGSRIAATVTDTSTGMQAWLPPGGRLPLVFSTTRIMFTAGPSTYEMLVHQTAPVWSTPSDTPQVSGETATSSAIPLTLSQRQLVVALAEAMLRPGGSLGAKLPSNREAANRLGWTLTRFNRKLDNVCEKLDRIGVEGVRGDLDALATHRRARLVEYAVSTGLVTATDLELLGEAPPEDEADEYDREAQPAAPAHPTPSPMSGPYSRRVTATPAQRQHVR